MKDEPVVIVGAGLAGCLLATLLGRRGFTVTVFDRRSDPQLVAAERGRSINLALSARGLDALGQVGLREYALGSALPMRGRMVHPTEGGTDFQPYSADGASAINSISRSDLNDALLELARATPGVSLVFDHRLEDIDLETGLLTLMAPDGVRQFPASVVLATDGAFSAARKAIQFALGFDFSQSFLSHGYKELTIPARDGDFALDPGALHIWGRGTAMMIALPNVDKSFTCTLFWPLAGDESFDHLQSPADIVGYFGDKYPDVVDLIPDLVDDFQHNPVGSLVTVKCWPWSATSAACTVALVGDAAHAIVPFYGQGANCALEDAIEIDRLLDVHPDDWVKVLADYQSARKPNSDAIAEMALENFTEMRDRVNSPWFRWRSTFVHALERRLNGRYKTRYELISFSTVPYSEVPSMVRRQNQRLALAATSAALAAVWGGSRALRATRWRRS